MHLAYSTEVEETLLKQVEGEIDSCRHPADGSIGSEERAHLSEWRNTLADALTAIKSALGET